MSETMDKQLQLSLRGQKKTIKSKIGDFWNREAGFTIEMAYVETFYHFLGPNACYNWIQLFCTQNTLCTMDVWIIMWTMTPKLKNPYVAMEW